MAIIGAGVPSVEHLPAALARRRFLRATGSHGAPVKGGKIDIHAKPLEKIDSYVALRLGDRDILSDQTGHRLARIAAFGEKLFRGVKVARPFQDIAALFGVERRAGREKARQRPPQVGVVADDGAHRFAFKLGDEPGTGLPPVLGVCTPPSPGASSPTRPPRSPPSSSQKCSSRSNRVVQLL